MNTIDVWLKEAIRQLEAAGIGTARLDALVLLSDVTDKDRAHLLAHPETKLNAEQLNHLQTLLNRRISHEPLAYIREKTEFYGREFYVNDSVLEPRPESETMIDLLKHIKFESNPMNIIDVGTGSGALAITAKLELPNAFVSAIDIDKNCLTVAWRNAQKHQVDITFVQNDLLKKPSFIKQDQPLVILANLPYVPDAYQINQAALKEPRIAIFGGPDGLDLYRTMFEQLSEHQEQKTIVLTESLPFQHDELLNIAKEHNFKLINQEDFIQVFRQN